MSLMLSCSDIPMRVFFFKDLSVSWITSLRGSSINRRINSSDQTISLDGFKIVICRTLLITD